MNKQKFLAQLRDGLSGLPQNEIEERLTFYSEMIDDRMEEGLSEAEAVSQIGPVNAALAQILADTPLTTLVKEKVTPKRGLKAWEIVLLILGFPLWFPLLTAGFSVVLSLYIVIWSVVISLWSVQVSFAACAIGGALAAVIFTLQKHTIPALAMLSAGICCAGISILLFFGCKAVTKGVLLLTKKIVLGIKTMMIGRGQHNG